MSKNQTFSGSVIKRFVKDYDAWVEEYKANRNWNRVMVVPSLNDIKISNWVSKTKSISQTAKEFGITNNRVYGAVARVSAYSKKTGK